MGQTVKTLDDETVVGIAASDLHFSHVPPVARSAEKSWYRAQRRCLDQLRQLKQEFNVPIIYAGDITHTWHERAELVNFLLEYMPEGYGIAGQHDLPNHVLSDIQRSVFWTLVKAGKIRYLEPGVPYPVERLILHGFSWNVPIVPCPTPPNDVCLNVALVHAFVWKAGHAYDGATEDKLVGKYADVLQGYDVAVFGDNHIGFTSKAKRDDGTVTSICNTGSFMRRNSDEVDYQPCIGLIKADGSVTRKPLDCRRDKFIEKSVIDKTGGILLEAGLKEFVSELQGDAKHGAVSIDFKEAVRRRLEMIHPEQDVEKLVLEMIGEDKR